MQFTCRNNTSHGNGTIQGTRGDHYDEIDSVLYNVNGRPELKLSNIPLETLLSSNNRNNVVNTATNNVDDGTNNEQEISLYGAEMNISGTDDASAWSYSDDSYLVPCQNYINLELGVTGEHRDNTREQEYLTDRSSASNSENSETQIKSDHQYETLATTNIEVHSYEIPHET
ncbi:unnamed protein product [Mytilus coruscus]|uniref:Uncharacterized protein n=1 Tax=Mytilus coruscus TaxID=42192 RepID=A0A6J8CU92_MYTCO|nr:unnamed protein product [Mytilus coruscus]